MLILSKIPVGVTNKLPSGLKHKRRKKPLKFSSPYIRIPARAMAPPCDACRAAIRCLGDGGARIAGSGGAGEGERGVIPRVRDVERELLPLGRSWMDLTGVELLAP